MSERSMAEIARLVKSHERALRDALRQGRSGLFQRATGECYVQSGVPLGGRYAGRVIQIFADEADLDCFLRLYLKGT